MGATQPASPQRGLGQAEAPSLPQHGPAPAAQAGLRTAGQHQTTEWQAESRPRPPIPAHSGAAGGLYGGRAAGAEPRLQEEGTDRQLQERGSRVGPGGPGGQHLRFPVRRRVSGFDPRHPRRGPQPGHGGGGPLGGHGRVRGGLPGTTGGGRRGGRPIPTPGRFSSWPTAAAAMGIVRGSSSGACSSSPTSGASPSRSATLPPGPPSGTRSSTSSSATSASTGQPSRCGPPIPC